MSDFRCTEEFVKQLFDAGMDVVRVNSAHVSEDGATHIVGTVHRVNPAIPNMIDTGRVRAGDRRGKIVASRRKPGNAAFKSSPGRDSGWTDSVSYTPLTLPT